MRPVRKLALAACLAASCGIASAGNVVIGSATGVPGSQVSVPVTMGGDGVLVDWVVDFQFSPGLDFVSVTAAGGANCIRRAAPNDNQIRVLAPVNPTNDPIPGDVVTYCTAVFEIPADAVPPATVNLTAAAQCFDNNGDSYPCASVTNGSVSIISTPPDVALSYAPTAGSTITFPAGVALTTQNASITVTGGGTVGSGTVTGCTITGPGSGAYGAPPADITVAAGATGNLPLTCTLPNSGGAASAVLTCTETDSDTPAPGAARTWNLSCPQGSPVPGPGYSSSPAPGSTLNCDGQPGSSTTASFTVTNNGNPGAGSELTFTCTAAGAGFSIVSGGTTTAPGLAIGASQTVVVGCTVPAEGAPAATGTVSCTTNAGSTPSYNLTSTGVIVPPPVARPAIVPATSYWSQALLVLLLAGLGMAFVGFRRS